MDVDLSDHLGLEGPWADPPDSTVSALPVVVQLNVLEHLSPHRPRIARRGWPRSRGVEETLDAGIGEQLPRRSCWTGGRTASAATVTASSNTGSRSLDGRSHSWAFSGSTGPSVGHRRPGQRLSARSSPSRSPCRSTGRSAPLSRASLPRLPST